MTADSETPLTALKFLMEIHQFGAGRFWSKEKPREPASNSELRRWIDQRNALQINGQIVKCNDVIDYDIESVVLFPKNPGARITLL